MTVAGLIAAMGHANKKMQVFVTIEDEDGNQSNYAIEGVYVATYRPDKDSPVKPCAEIRVVKVD